MRAAHCCWPLALLRLRAGEALPVLGEIPQFELTAQTGQPFDSHTLDGHIWVADFIYTTCDGPCPMMSHQMRGIQNSTRAAGCQAGQLHGGSGARHAAGAAAYAAISKPISRAGTSSPALRRASTNWA